MMLKRRSEAVPQTTKLPQGEYPIMVWGPNEGKKPLSFFLIMEVIDGHHQEQYIAQSFLGFKPDFIDDLLKSYDEPRGELRASDFMGALSRLKGKYGIATINESGWVSKLEPADPIDEIG